MPRRKRTTILVGSKFGLLMVEAHLGRFRKEGTKRPKRYYRCGCECGNEVVVTGSNLVTGHTKACGCQRRIPRTNGSVPVSERF